MAFHSKTPSVSRPLWNQTEQNYKKTFFSQRNKMKVSLAAEVLSSSVANAIYILALLESCQVLKAANTLFFLLKPLIGLIAQGSLSG